MRAAVIVVFVLSVAAFVDDASAQPELVTLTPTVNGDCISPCTKPAIVFIHGLAGSRDTWKDGGGVAWPDLMRQDTDLSGRFSTYELDYLTHTETAVQKSGTIPSATNIVESMVRVARPALSRHPAVYFVCHSLGGNLARHYLVLIGLSAPGELSRYKGLFLLGTPVEGSSLARFIDFAGRHSLFGGASGTYKIKSTLAVLVENDYLQLVNQLWRPLVGSATEQGQQPINVWAAYERPVFGFVTVVSRESAVAAIPPDVAGVLKTQNRICGFDKNHMQLPKPRDRGDPAYTWVKGEILKSAGLRPLDTRTCLTNE